MGGVFNPTMFIGMPVVGGSPGSPLYVDANGALANGAGIYYSATGTSTLTRTARTFTTVAGMTHTPLAGTYLAIWSGQVRTGNASGAGETAIFVGATQQAALTHQTELEVTIILGLLGIANLTEGAGNIIGVVTANGTDAVTVQYRSVDGQTITITNRSFVLLRIA